MVNQISSSAQKSRGQAKYIRYTPIQQTSWQNSGATQRLIKMVEAPIDPLSLPKSKHKRIPGGDGDAPPPVFHSPNRKLTAKDQQDYKIPLCVSNWVNSKGHMRPIQALTMAQGRNQQETTVNQRFGEVTDALYAAESAARKEIQLRNKIQEGNNLILEQQNQMEIKKKAALARQQKTKMLQSTISAIAAGNQNSVFPKGNKQTSTQKPVTTTVQGNIDDLQDQRNNYQDDKRLMEDKRERDQARRQRALQIERNLRLENRNKKAKYLRDQGRDITQKIALGQAQPTNKEAVFDQRLFNQTAGLDHGLLHDDEYNLYDQPLFHDRTAASIYKNVKQTAMDEDQIGNENQKNLRKLMRSGLGIEKDGKNNIQRSDGPVQFVKSEGIKSSLDHAIDKQNEQKKMKMQKEDDQARKMKKKRRQEERSQEKERQSKKRKHSKDDLKERRGDYRHHRDHQAHRDHHQEPRDHHREHQHRQDHDERDRMHYKHRHQSKYNHRRD